MSTSLSSGNRSVSSRTGKRRKPRLTRAGNDIDSFPFDKLSVDGAELAKSIISPLPNPSFSLMRTRDPLDLDLDSTSSTYDSSGSSDPDHASPNPIKTVKNIDEISAGKSKQSKSSFPSSSSNQSKKDAFQTAMNSLPSVGENEPTTKSISASTRMDIFKRMEPTVPKSSKTFTSNVSKKSADRSIEPEARHINRIFRTTRSRDSQTDGSRDTEPDTYYEVYDSPRANEIYEGPLNDTEFSANSSDLSKMKLPLSPSNNINDQAVPAPASPYSRSPSGPSRRIDADGSVYLSPQQNYHRKQFLNEEASQPQTRFGVAEYSTSGSTGRAPGEGPLDPDGDVGDTHSTHGESLVPTPDELEGDYNRSFDYSQDGQTSSGRVYSGRTSGKASSSDYPDESSDESESESEVDLEGSTSHRSPSASSSKPPVERSSPFPSYRMLVCLVILIILVIAGLVAGLTYYLWEKRRLAPIRPPGSGSNDPSPTVPGIVVPGSDDSELTPLIPTDEELYEMFETANDGARLPYTVAGKAADWMIYEDPGKTLKIRSKDAWIQRYLLVFTYFSTTLNRSNSWLSCNPPTENSMSDDTCKYTYPTELPGGRIIYDMVPSHTWLSAADECKWGGVACGVTVTDEIMASKADGSGSDQNVTTTMTRSAVTSIVLAGQYLKGAIVTELSQLPMLERLDLSHNGLKGTLSESFRSIKTLRLQYNNIEGKIPSNFFDDQSAMEELNIGANEMSGSIPSEVGLVSKMSNLYLFDNMFTGTIPVLGNMPLINFQAQENKFTGIMPFDYSYSGTWADTLREWWVYDNQLTGSLSESLSFLTSLEDLRINNNKLTGSIPESILDLKRLFRLDVHSNALTGTVPEGIGSLPVLRDVRLQFNSLDGIVPTSLCFLESMEVLEADCLAPEGSEDAPQTDCYCCTTCCNPKDVKCQFY